jgi:hypothetical protein
MRGQLRNQVINLRRTAPTLYVGRDSGEWLAAQNVLHERRQVSARPSLDKETYAIGVHRLDHSREFDGLNPVINREGTDRIGMRGKDLAC